MMILLKYLKNQLNIILLDFQNNYVERSSMIARNFLQHGSSYVFCIIILMIQIYFVNLYLFKFLDTLTKLFFPYNNSKSLIFYATFEIRERYIKKSLKSA